MVFKASDKWAPRETALLSEWVKKTFPDDRVLIRVRVGAPPDDLVKQVGAERADALSKVFKRWVDAVVLRPNEVILIEAKVRGTLAAIGQLQVYSGLFAKTPEFAAHANKPRRLVLLTPWVDPDVNAVVGQMGIDVEVYRPAWLNEYLDMLQGYTTRDAIAARDAKGQTTLTGVNRP